MTWQNQNIQQRYQQTLNDINNFAKVYHRNPSDLRLIAVSKRHSSDKVFELIECGHRDFAENYLQEALEKIKQVETLCTNSELTDPITWHFIGHIQSRKCKDIANSFDWVHTIESIKVAEKLSQNRVSTKPLNVLIQLNLQKEEAKSGVELEDLFNLAKNIYELPNLILRGLMIIPEVETIFEKQLEVFSNCRSIMESLNQDGFNLDQLSMGMTNDMEAAIAEGATQIRIGTAIFGLRP